MKSFPIRIAAITAKLSLVIITGAFISVMLLSFTVRKKMNDDFLKQLGISKVSADKKISRSLLNGSLDGYGLKNLKNIAAGDKKAIANDLLQYTKQFVNSDAYINEYIALRESNKPEMQVLQTPEEMQAGLIKSGKESEAMLLETIKKADASSKEIFEKSLESVRKQLKEIEDPNNKSMAGYRKGYPMLVKNRDEVYQKRLVEWELEYPADHLQYIKIRLQQFMEETRDIDFTADTREINGIKYFTNKAYEQKSDRWKMAYRAGKDVVETSRKFAEAWMNEIK